MTGELGLTTLQESSACSSSRRSWRTPPRRVEGADRACRTTGARDRRAGGPSRRGPRRPRPVPAGTGLRRSSARLTCVTSAAASRSIAARAGVTRGVVFPRMRILLAGATGAIGKAAARAFCSQPVMRLSRRHGRAGLREALEPSFGAEGVVLRRVRCRRGRRSRGVADAKPEVVIHQLTALPAEVTPKAMKEALVQTNRLRRETGPSFARARGSRWPARGGSSSSRSPS